MGLPSLSLQAEIRKNMGGPVAQRPVESKADRHSSIPQWEPKKNLNSETGLRHAPRSGAEQSIPSRYEL